MSDLTDRLRQVASDAPPGPWVGVVGAATTQIFAGDGSFVLAADVSRRPTHRYACTFDPELVAAMLDVIDAAEYRLAKDDTCWCPEPVDDDTVCGSCRERESLARFREVSR